MATTPSVSAPGPNDWFVEELRQQYLANPKSVSPEWRQVFEENGLIPATPPALPSLSPALPSVSPEATGTEQTTQMAEGREATADPNSRAPSVSPEATGTEQPTQMAEGREATADPNNRAPSLSPEATGTEQPTQMAEGREATVGLSPEATGTNQPTQMAEGRSATADPNSRAGREATADPNNRAQPLRGAAARIVANMELSLGVPTATSFREVPAKLLEINRKVLNNHLIRVRGGKSSFTHIIGYAIVRAIVSDVQAMNDTYEADAAGKPMVVRNDHVNLGIAVDQQKSDGSRTLIVPVIKAAETMNFAEFVAAYESLIRKVRDNKIVVDDLMGANVSLTNVGTIGTVQSVPRLMPGQGVIVGVGRLGFPTAFAAADPKMLAQLGLSKVMTISSTYDHRIIQGAESGMFLRKIHEYLVGDHGFYDQIFTDMNVPYQAVKWRVDHGATEGNDADGAMAKQLAVNTLINQYRVRGHMIANTNPLSDGPSDMHPELDPATFGLTIWDLDREFLTGSTTGVYASVGGAAKQMKLGDILGELRDAYCRTIGIEYMHIADPEQKRWIQEQVESNPYSFTRDQQHHILERLSAAEALEKFLAARYVGQKRFGLEGVESTIPILDALLSAAAGDGLERAVIGMTHRGRLNVLVNIMGKRHNDLFREFEGAVGEDDIQGSGDVKYHLGFDGTHTSPDGHTIQIELAANPSHLEAVDPVVVGMVRAYMDQTDADNYPVLPLLLHGDAAFCGQGVVPETLNLSQIRGYKVGGTIHLVVNNQLGYTTAPHQSRSSDYSTDVAKIVQAPILHVNADDPEACTRVAELAFAYRQRFNRDVVIDMVGYRRHGHNEGDEPSYTQPMMYRKIAARPSARTIYTQTLIDRGDITIAEAEAALEYFQKLLQEGLDLTRGDAPDPGILAKPSPPAVGVVAHVETGVSRQALDRVYAALSHVPEGFTVHPKLLRQFEGRNKMWANGDVDWALGEAFAIGTLLDSGVSVRLAGQDSRRGTFAHRHATLHDYENGAEFTPLGELAGDGTDLWIYDSTLSEYAALGFEYGYSLVNKEALVMWEAQFGDFVNGAQIIIDQFLVAAEDKWKEQTGLVMLLPHGFEGQGPEHSSGRVERFLLLCAEDNIQVVNATNAAQLFHLLRRQIVRREKKPLVVFTPKSGLRAKWSRSRVEDLLSGSFEEVLDDPDVRDPSSVRRIVFASGKVAAEAIERRNELDVPVAVVRVEQLYPWPFADVAKVLQRYGKADEIVWLQEEPENMGPWNSVKGRLYERHGKTHQIRRVSRTESGSPATGSAAIHKQEQAELLDRAFSF